MGKTLDGAVVNHLGSFDASAYEIISANGLRLSSFAFFLTLKLMLPLRHL